MEEQENTVEEATNTAGDTAGRVEIPEGVPESINLNDLQLLVQIVDLASSRGAFRGAELTQVGAVFDKVNSFLAFVKEQQEKARAEASETTDEAPESEEESAE